MTRALLQQMLRDLPFSMDELASLIRTAPYRYKVYQIPKRQPNQYRTIAQPSYEVKLLQHWLMGNVFAKLPIHTAARAYRNGVSIRDHAARHVKKRYLLKMDFTNFFPSIRDVDVQRHLVRFGKLSQEEARIVSQIVCWSDRTRGEFCLSIGAPSSPCLSNTLLYEFDKKAAALARDSNVVYSRYADDLAFSTNRRDILINVAAAIPSLCSNLEYPRLAVNDNKTVFTSRAFRRTLVGLVLTPESNVSLGRTKKRKLRSELYRFANNKLSSEEEATLRGQLAFAWSVEPSFIRSLIRQRGAEVFERLQLPFRT